MYLFIKTVLFVTKISYLRKCIFWYFGLQGQIVRLCIYNVLQMRIHKRREFQRAQVTGRFCFWGVKWHTSLKARPLFRHLFIVCARSRRAHVRAALRRLLCKLKDPAALSPEPRTWWKWVLFISNHAFLRDTYITWRSHTTPFCFWNDAAKIKANTWQVFAIKRIKHTPAGVRWIKSQAGAVALYMIILAIRTVTAPKYFQTLRISYTKQTPVNNNKTGNSTWDRH